MKYMLAASLLLVPPLLLAAAAQAQITVTGAWARASAPGQDDGAVYLSITSPTADRLTAAASPESDMAMLHRTVRQGAMSSMQDMAGLDIPAGKTVALSPHGTHLMLMGLKHPLKPGQAVSVDLTFAKAGTVHVNAPVEPLGATGPRH